MASPMGFYQSASVRRPGRSLSSTQQLATAPATIYASLDCRVSPMPSRLRETVLGDFSTEQLLIEWGEEDLLRGDLVDIGGKTYSFAPLQSDTFRPPFSRVEPYKTGILTEQKRPRS